MTEVAGLRVLVVRLEALDARPLLDRLANRVADIGRQQALLDVDHLVPAAGPMEAEHEVGAVRAVRERVLELVAVAILGPRGNDRVDGRIDEPPETRERVADLRLLRLDLARVGEVLEPAAAADTEMPTRRVDPIGTGLEHGCLDRLGESTLDLRRASAHEIARETSAHEHDEAVEPPDSVASVGERVDPNLDLLTLGDWCSHRAS